MKTAELKKKLHNYIDAAQEKKLKAIYTMIEEELDEINDFWEDDGFVAELERREKEYLDGKAKTYTVKATIAGVNKVIEKAKAKK
jgi:beta-phosphoglucomutase-like phosphatase (HAD superfamily)